MQTSLIWNLDLRQDFLGTSESPGPTKSFTGGRQPSSGATSLASGQCFLLAPILCPRSSGISPASQPPFSS